MGLKRREKREGFWFSSDEPHLPKPTARDDPHPSKDKTMKALAICESLSDNEGRTTRYKGSSTCRICGSKNGSREFQLDGWAWPEGLSHYVKEHNVRLSQGFQEFILAAS